MVMETSLFMRFMYNLRVRKSFSRALNAIGIFFTSIKDLVPRDEKANVMC